MSGLIDFAGIYRGAIGKKLPSDTTLNNMRKSELIELLHIAEHNYKALSEIYSIAVDNSKCNSCLLGKNAYNVDEVVKELEEASFYDTYLSEETKVIDRDKAIEIVKAGGKNDD